MSRRGGARHPRERAGRRRCLRRQDAEEDGFALCRAIRRDARIRHVPVVFYSSIFTGAAHELGMDLGATAYLDAKRILPDKVAKEIEQDVSRLVNVEYREALARLHDDDLEFARRYHAVVLSTDTSAEPGSHTRPSAISARQRARHARQPAGCRRPGDRAQSPERAGRSAPRGDESARCRRRGPPGAATEAPGTVSDNAAASMRLTVRRINELVRKLSARKHVMEPDG